MSRKKKIIIKLLVFAWTLCIGILIYGCSGGDKSNADTEKAVPMNEFVDEYNKQLAAQDEIIRLGDFEQTSSKDSWTYSFADHAVISVATISEKSTDIYAFAVVTDYEIVGVKTSVSALVSGIMALDSNIDLEEAAIIANSLFTTEYEEGDELLFTYNSENSTYSAELSGRNLILRGRLTNASVPE